MDLNELVLKILKGPSDITYYDNLLTRILVLNGWDKKILKILSNSLIAICD